MTVLNNDSGSHTLWADKAPADVDVRVVTVAFLSPEVVCAHNGRRRQHLTARSNTQVSNMIGNGTTQTTHHLSCKGTMGNVLGDKTNTKFEIDLAFSYHLTY